MDSRVSGRHPDDDSLVLLHYDEAPEVIRRHVAGCVACMARRARLARVLAAVPPAEVPEPDEAFEARMWSRIEPGLLPRRAGWREWMSPARVALAGSMAALLLVAFVAGRIWPHPGALPTVKAPTAVSGAAAGEQAMVRARVVLGAIGEHLDQSQLTLTEIANADGTTPVDISAEQDRARDLVLANRLLRQTVETSRDPAVAGVLDELERVLLEITHAPSELGPAELNGLRRRIETQELIFKLRVAGSTVRQREESLAPLPARSRS